MRQHYVPRAYLKYFSIKKNNEFVVWVYDKQINKHFQTSIKNVAVEKDLYLLNNIDDEHIIKEGNAWEDYYSKEVEPALSNLIGGVISQFDNKLISNRSIALNDELKDKFSLQIVYQIYRGKNALNKAEIIRGDISEEIRLQAEELAVDMYGENNSIDIDSYLKNNELWRLSYAEAAVSGKAHGRLIKRLKNRLWILYKITDNNQFVTSDSPVLLYNASSKSVGLFQAGFGFDSTILYYPVSPKLLIAIYSDNYLFGSMEMFNNKICLLTSKDKVFIDNVNQLQLQNCIRQIYSVDKIYD